MTELKIGDTCIIKNIATDDPRFGDRELIGKQVTIIGDHIRKWGDGCVACQVELGGETMLFSAVTLEKVAEKSG